LIDRLKLIAAVTEVRANGNGIDVYAGRGGSLIGEIAADAAENSVDLNDVHISEPSLENLSSTTRKEHPPMNWKTFGAPFARDLRVAHRNLLTTILQTMLQPLLFVFVFGQVMTRSGMMAPSYRGMLLPGIMAISMTMTGTMGVAIPLIAEFQFTKEIEDRLLAPIQIEWMAVEKIISGMIQAFISATIVALPARLFLGSGLGLSTQYLGLFLVIAVLVAIFAAAGGMTLGCSVGQTQIGLIFSLVLAPLIMFGCAYYPWASLASFPILQKLVLINPLVYASEGLRGTLAPQYPHMSPATIIAVLAVIDATLIFTALNRFQRKAVT
jgi:ABC-2 type transport system permease protein